MKALKTAEELGEKRNVSIWLDNIGNLYHEQNDYYKAQKYYFRALEINKELEDKDGIAIVLNNIGELYIDKKLYEYSEVYLLKSLSIAKEIGSLNYIEECYKNLSTLYFSAPVLKTIEGRKNRSKNGIFALAFGYYEKYLQVKNTIFNEGKSIDMDRMEARHEFALAEMEREREEREQQIAVVAAIKRRNTVQYSVIFILLIVVVLVTVLFLFAKFNISGKLKIGSVFITLLFLFEFVLLIADTELEKITKGDPVFKLGINAVLAVFFYFIQQYTEKNLTVNKLSTPITTQPFSSFLILFLIVPLFSGFVKENNFSHKDTMVRSSVNNETNNQTIKQC